MSNAQTKTYIGITIGPVFDTINLTSSPAALWAGSYLFSTLTRTLCTALMDHGVPKEHILSPSLAKIETSDDGIGLYHDRIIFLKGDFNIKRFSDVKTDAINSIAKQFGIDKTFLTDYLLIAAAQFEAVNPLLESDPALNSLELARPFVQNAPNNPILSLFINRDANDTEEGSSEKIGNNENVKKLMADFSRFQLKKGDCANGIVLKSLEDIAATKNDGMKKHRYFAIVRSDGDSIGNLLKSLQDDDARRCFSEDCLKFCSDTAALVGRYGGVTIFSGGDDLLALLPCESKDSQTPFEFVREANKLFKDSFAKRNAATPTYPAAIIEQLSLSFSVTMSFYKFPLYEALETSQNLLFGCAKSIKNGAVVYLQKHAGQSEGVFVSNDAIDELIQFKDSITTQKDDVLVSALYKIDLFAELLNQTADQNAIENLFVNLFDAAAHKGNTFVHKTLPALFCKLQNGLAIYALDKNGICRNKTLDSAKTLCYLMRICKFFTEKEGVTS